MENELKIRLCWSSAALIEDLRFVATIDFRKRTAVGYILI